MCHTWLTACMKTGLSGGGVACGWRVPQIGIVTLPTSTPARTDAGKAVPAVVSSDTVGLGSYTCTP